MTEIGPGLRALIKRARNDPSRWGRSKGLSQQDVAKMAGTSQVWLRQIEAGYTETASADTLGNICYVLHIKPKLIRDIGYPDVADAIEAAIMLREGKIPEHLAGDHPRARSETLSGLSADEKEELAEVLREMRRVEPLGRDIWRSRRRRA